MRLASALDKRCRSAEVSRSNLKSRADSGGGVRTEAGLREAPREGGGERHSGGEGYLA